MFSCGLCHSSLLHIDKSEENTAKREEVSDSLAPTNAFSKNENYHALSNLSKEKKKSVLLSTCFIFIDDLKGKRYRVRAIMDSGSNINCLLNECTETLKKYIVNIPVSDLNGSTQNIK